MGVAIEARITVFLWQKQEYSLIPMDLLPFAPQHHFLNKVAAKRIRKVG